MKLPRLNNIYLDRSILAVENFMSLYLVIGGLQTAFSGGIASTTSLGLVLGSGLSILLFGLALFSTGCMLLYSSIAFKQDLHAKVLMFSFFLLTFTFFAELVLRTGGVDSGVFAIISALIYLRCKRLSPLKRAKHKTSEKII
jgi:hypothetical protein